MQDAKDTKVTASQDGGGNSQINPQELAGEGMQTQHEGQPKYDYDAVTCAGIINALDRVIAAKKTQPTPEQENR